MNSVRTVTCTLFRPDQTVYILAENGVKCGTIKNVHLNLSSDFRGDLETEVHYCVTVIASGHKTDYNVTPDLIANTKANLLAKL